MDDWYILAAVISLIALFYAGYSYHKKLEGDYRSNLLLFARDQHMEFYPDDSGVIIQKLSDFPIFLEGRAHNAANILSRHMSAYELLVFDHSYKAMRETFRQTATILEFTRMDVPNFKLRFERAIFRGSSGIKFSLHPLFSRSYNLEGDPEDSTRELFQTDLIHLFEANLGLCFEGNKNKVLLYRDNSLVEAKDMSVWIQLCDKLAFLLMNARGVT